ncbi:MAG: ankyrin repeat domain-containing protein [Gemmatimonadales bacterium]
MTHANVIGVLGMLVLLSAAPADSPVADAAERGDIEMVRSLLKTGADVNAAQGDGMTALHWAALHDNADMATMLVYAGANLEATTRLGGNTPLHLASRQGNTITIEALLEAGSDVNAFTSTGVRGLHLAAAAGDQHAAAALLFYGAEVDGLDLHSGRTPLMFATANNRLEVIETLLAAGADISIATTAVDYAARSEEDGKERSRRNKVMRAAREVEEEARAESESQQSVADASAAQLQSREEPREPRAERQEKEQAEAVPQDIADSSAAELKSEPLGEEKADSGSNPEEKPDSAGRSEPREQSLSYADLVGNQGGMGAMHYAARDGHMEAIRMFLSGGADIDQRTGGDQSTPLLVAAINGNYDLAMYLIDQGADPNLVSEDGVAPIYAVLNNRWAPKALYPQPTAFKQQEASYLDLMEALLIAGAEPNTRVTTHIWYTSFNFDLLGVNFSGATPFWRAAHATDVAAMKLLIAYGADPNIPTTKAPPRRRRNDDDDEDQSGLPPVPTGGDAVWPIHAASGVGYGVARAGNSHRHVPDGWLPAVRYLVEELAVDVNVRDHDGYSAVHFAAARGDNEVIEYLEENYADVTVMSRRGQTTVDMANGPIQRVQPFPKTIALLESLGAVNNHNCVSC